MTRIRNSSSVYFRRLQLQFWTSFLAACLLAFTLELLSDRLIAKSEGQESGIAQSILDITGLYQQLVTAGPRKPISHFTAIVEITLLSKTAFELSAPVARFKQRPSYN